MKLLVANLGSTSFKYRLFDMSDERVLARRRRTHRLGPVALLRRGERRPRGDDPGGARPRRRRAALPANSCPIRKGAVLKVPSELAAIGFKAVHAQGMTGVQRVDDKVLAAMEAYADVAPAHNPPYVAAMRLLAPRAAARFRSSPRSRRAFTRPFRRRNGFMLCRWSGPRSMASSAGAFTARAIATLPAARRELLGKPDAKIISCHLGGSSSLCAVQAGQSVACSLGMSPQSGLPHNNRVGDFDVFALPVLLRATGKTLEQLLDDLANRSGLLGLSGHNDLRDIEEARRPRATAGAAGARRIRRVGAALPGRVSAAARRRGRDRVHRRHRRKLGGDAGGDLCRPRLVRHPPRPADNAKAKGEMAIHAAVAVCSCGSCRRTRSWSSPGRRRTCWNRHGKVRRHVRGKGDRPGGGDAEGRRR